MNILINTREITETGIDWHQIYVFFYLFHTFFSFPGQPFTYHTCKKKRKIHTPMKNAAISPVFTPRNSVQESKEIKKGNKKEFKTCKNESSETNCTLKD